MTVQVSGHAPAVQRRYKRLPRYSAVLSVCCFLILCINVIYFFGSQLLHVETTMSAHDAGRMMVVPKHRPMLAADLRLAELDCKGFGGPSPEIAQEMVYWQNIPSDAKFVSPFKEGTREKYLTFELDEGGFNNIRMALETVLALAHAMGRTLVLPPEQKFYLLAESNSTSRAFGIHDFFSMDRIASEQAGLDIISTEEFLVREALAGRINDKSGERAYPPRNRTNWDGVTGNIYVGKPTPVYASVMERLAEIHRGRQRICMYNSRLAKEQVLHFGGKKKTGIRLLVHFYGFLFFQNWKQDTWTKRFIRDYVGYHDTIQCAAARVVDAVRQRAKERDPTNVNGEYDAFHVRRGEFQYQRTRVDAWEIYEASKQELREGFTVYIATDEKKKRAFFYDMAAHYDIVFLDDFSHLLEGVDTNFFGMIDQLVASKSRIFFGCWFSTFTSYINRIRGYHADRLKLPGFQKGVIESYFYALPEHKYKMKDYWPLNGAFHSREFPISWRNIDQGVKMMDSKGAIYVDPA